MKEKIIRIEEVTFKVGTYEQFEGFQVVTNKQAIKLGISNEQCCCENWGYFMTNGDDDLEEFKGASLLSISTTDSALNVKKLEDKKLYEPCLMFVNLNTDRGVLQFTAYNEHNGYYGHSAIVISEQFEHKEGL